MIYLASVISSWDDEVWFLELMKMNEWTENENLLICHILNLTLVHSFLSTFVDTISAVFFPQLFHSWSKGLWRAPPEWFANYGKQFWTAYWIVYSYDV